MGYVAWILECAVRDRDALDAVMKDLLASVEANERDTTVYEWNLSEDGSSLVIYERFTDADAALAHLEGFGAHAERFMAALTVMRVVVFGHPNDPLREALAGFSPIYTSPIGGFDRRA